MQWQLGRLECPDKQPKQHLCDRQRFQSNPPFHHFWALACHLHTKKKIQNQYIIKNHTNKTSFLTLHIHVYTQFFSIYSITGHNLHTHIHICKEMCIPFFSYWCTILLVGEDKTHKDYLQHVRLEIFIKMGHTILWKAWNKYRNINGKP